MRWQVIRKCKLQENRLTRQIKTDRKNRSSGLGPVIKERVRKYRNGLGLLRALKLLNVWKALK